MLVGLETVLLTTTLTGTKARPPWTDNEWRRISQDNRQTYKRGHGGLYLKRT